MPVINARLLCAVSIRDEAPSAYAQPVPVSAALWRRGHWEQHHTRISAGRQSPVLSNGASFGFSRNVGTAGGSKLRKGLSISHLAGLEWLVAAVQPIGFRTREHPPCASHQD